MKYYLCMNNNFDFLLTPEQKDDIEPHLKPGNGKTVRLENCIIKTQYAIGIFNEKKMRERDIARETNRCYECGQILEKYQICDCILEIQKEAEKFNTTLVEKWNKYNDVRTGFNKAYHQVRNTNVKSGLLPLAEVNQETNKLIAKISLEYDMRKIGGTIKAYAEEIINRFPDQSHSVHRYTYIQFFKKSIYLNYMS